MPKYAPRFAAKMCACRYLIRDRLMLNPGKEDAPPTDAHDTTFGAANCRTYPVHSQLPHMQRHSRCMKSISPRSLPDACQARSGEARCLALCTLGAFCSELPWLPVAASLMNKPIVMASPIL